MDVSCASDSLDHPVEPGPINCSITYQEVDTSTVTARLWRILREALLEIVEHLFGIPHDSLVGLHSAVNVVFDQTTHPI